MMTHFDLSLSILIAILFAQLSNLAHQPKFSDL
jgi:hypothetical protein